MVTLDIFSDPICPWCYIGKARLDAALTARPGHPFKIEWHPFQLNPDMPAGGMDRRAYVEGKFGGADGYARAYAPVIREAEAAGLELNLDKITRTPNTLAAHRLIHWAGIEGRQTAMVSRLFRAYFVEGRDIGAPDELAALAADVEMDPELVTRLLASGADADDIAARDADARAKGVQAVPTFLVARRHVVPGAQPTDLWISVIDELVEAAANAED